ncbi:MAG: hypothetical protein BJ554DRAFT_17 [Olpidium bornovanus]|uniref:Uncharacterized protein n=1 Tax=Olpidium bornovanus TaxID=278681 RepID=A0A8H7ZU67_9FUNG|nr:MAG: hypothetical protein BJ554DRAFT_17 [Olpidium bornovanus]
MVQSFTPAGLRYAFKLLTSPRLFVPHLVVEGEITHTSAADGHARPPGRHSVRRVRQTQELRSPGCCLRQGQLPDRTVQKRTIPALQGGGGGGGGDGRRGSQPKTPPRAPRESQPLGSFRCFCGLRPIWPFQPAWECCRRVFGADNVVIVSNSAGTNDDPGFEQVSSTGVRDSSSSVKVAQRGAWLLINRFARLQAGRIETALGVSACDSAGTELACRFSEPRAEAEVRAPPHIRQKPGCGGELFAHLRRRRRRMPTPAVGQPDVPATPSADDASLEDVQPHEVTFIGDRIFTDVAFGNANGMVTIWTRQAITEEGDNFVAKMLRRFEHHLLRFLLAREVRPPSHRVVPEMISKSSCQSPPGKG